jgi:CubicO group peptidase (beta-lactamase class C family)
MNGRKIYIILILLVVTACGNENSEKQSISVTEEKVEWNYNPAGGWKFISLKEAGIDSLVLDSINSEILVQQKKNSDYRSFLIVKGNYLSYEKYYDGGGKVKLNSLKSVTKSVNSLLVGKAIELKLIKGVDQKISDFFPEYFKKVTDERKREITIENLLTMSAGFRWNNFGGKYRSGWDLYKGNRHEYMITHTVMENEPGEVYNYNSGLSHMLSGIITNESGMSTANFAEKYLFDSLGIKKYKWTADRNGYNLGNSELFLSSKDMAKIGLLVLRKGFWFDKQLIEKDWIEEMLSPKIETAGVGKKYCKYYGYQWWIKNYKGINIYFAAGYGGQYIFVIPGYDLVSVVTTNWRTSTVSFVPLSYIERIVKSFLN